ncbi:MAG: efflux RND transporter periplasmic adaptor subunit [Prevotellaceae bacterium]|jgi:multidrug resistance efflux pump|nr:efflux RND transporter periplasmic adaptor subunit [Prevotellaceae bacterium]
MKKLSIIGTLLSLALACTDGAESGRDARTGGLSIVETGELAAVNSRTFVMPRYGRYWHEMRIIGLLEHGAVVSAGDSIIQLDPTDIKKFILDRESDLATQQAAEQKLRVDLDNRISDLEARVRSETAAFNLKRIELESSRFESARLKKIKELEFEQAKITLEKEKKTLEVCKIINANDLKIQQIRVRQIENELNNAYNILPTLTLRTPISGIFQIALNYRNGTSSGVPLVKIGDNIYAGNILAHVPELKWMKVNTFINEIDFLKIAVGQDVAVRLDAMPKVVFGGKVAYIGKLCHLRDSNSRQKVFDVEVNITQPDERLRPGMTVSCEFLGS